MSTGFIALNMIMNGPAGNLVPLGFENWMTPQMATMYYNYLATILLLLIAATTGSRGEPAYCVLIPIFAGTFTLFGWFSFAGNINALAMMIIAGAFGVMIYMNETNHDRNGVAGPGSKLLNIVFFIILFQTVLGIMPAMGLFDPTATGAPSYNQTYCPPSAHCGAYSNVDISYSMSEGANTGGFISGAVSVLTGATTAFIGMVLFLVTTIINVLLSVTVIANLIEGLWPGVTTTPAFLAFMALVSVVFWACDLIFISNVFLKLFPSEGSL
jgi:hypothetical protein